MVMIMTTLGIQLVSAIFTNDSFKVKSLLVQGADVNDRSLFNLSPLQRAVLYDKPEALKVLLEFGADINVKDSQGLTALELAKKHNHPQIVEILKLKEEQEVK